MPRLFSKILFFRENWKSDGKEKFDNDDCDDDIGKERFRTDASTFENIIFPRKLEIGWKKKRKFDDNDNDDNIEERFGWMPCLF